MEPVSIIITMHNDAGIIRGTIQKTLDFLSESGIEAEVIIAEDGSTDGTDKIARELANRLPNVFHLHDDNKLGKGLAIERGVKFAHHAVVMFMDSDLATDLSCIPDLIGGIFEGASIVVGSRMHPQTRIQREFPRTLLSKVFNLIVRVLFRIKLSDMQCGFKAFRKREVMPLFKLILQKKWAWDTELLVLATRAGLKIREIPLIWREGADTKVNVVHNTVEHVKGLVQLRWRLFTDKKLKRVLQAMAIENKS
ncbi:MAG: glycosyltransferase [Promethearchaeota archaeon]